MLIPATLSDPSAPIPVSVPVGNSDDSQAVGAAEAVPADHAAAAGGAGDQKQNLAPTCIALAILVVLVALCSNLIAFLLFYKKPVFRKILSNR